MDGGGIDTLEVRDGYAVSLATELPNLSGHRARLANEMERASRLGTPLSLLLVDVDRLKDVNDRHGHAAGDEAIRCVAESLRQSCRNTDHAARVLSHLPEDFALDVMERMLRMEPVQKDILDKLEATLGKYGLERFGAKGEEFDPMQHEALMHAPWPEGDDDLPSDALTTTVVTVLQPGYRAGEQVLRPARVAVADPA